MAHEPFFRSIRQARYIGAWAFIDGKRFNRSNIITNGESIQSYGDHFTMARKHNGAILVNTDKFSMTTSKHQSALIVVLRSAGYHPTDEACTIDRYAGVVWSR